MPRRRLLVNNFSPGEGMHLCAVPATSVGFNRLILRADVRLPGVVLPIQDCSNRLDCIAFVVHKVWQSKGDVTTAQAGRECKVFYSPMLVCLSGLITESMI